MSFAGVRPPAGGREQAGQTCLIGLGNVHRRDDGVGPYVISRLEEICRPGRGLKLLSCHQLAPELADELNEAGLVVLVDATLRPVEAGVEWVRLPTGEDQTPPLTHSLAPSFLAALVGALYGRRPEFWLVGIQGEDFGFGQELSPLVRKRAEGVIQELAGLAGMVSEES